MSISNNIDSSSFSRNDVIKTYQVVQYFGGILTQYPIVYNVNLEYSNTTGIITASGITSFQATSGTTQTPLTLKGANSNSATRPGGSVLCAAGAGVGGSSGGNVVLRAGAGGGILGFCEISVSNQQIALYDRTSASLIVADGGMSFEGGPNDTGTIFFAAGSNSNYTAGRPIYFGTDSGTIFEMWEETPGTQKIGFFGSNLTSKQTTSANSASYTPGTTSGTFHPDDTYGGYTIGQIVTALKAYGLLE